MVTLAICNNYNQTQNTQVSSLTVSHGATYQRAMVALFHDIIHHEIEVYVNDMIARSQTEEEHLDHLQKLFDRLRVYKLRLNMNKCTFGVRSGKILGFIISDKGIQADPAKVKAIQEMTVPRTEKEVRGFLGRLNYIARFFSHLTSTCEPIFKLLKKDQVVEWNDIVKLLLIESRSIC